MKVFVYTLGCKLNQCESEAIADAFAHEGFIVAGADEGADLYVVNTCTVTTKAEQKARRMIRKYAAEKQHPVVLVTGCYAQMEAREIESLGERVVVVSLDEKPALLHLPRALANRLVAHIDLLSAIRQCVSSIKEEPAGVTPFDYDAASFSFHSRAFLKIQDGCDNSCAYCRVSIARGKAVSLDHEEVAKRCLALEGNGFAEIVLTGVNISAYRSGELGLDGLLRLLLVQVDSHTRIRLSSLEPDKLDDRLIDVFSDGRIQPHFHLPVQSASDEVLKRVNRHYDVEQLARSVESLRKVKDDPFIAADMITGLPGEDDLQFERSLEMIKALDFSQLHVFPFSPRPQTALFGARDRVPESVRDQRAKVLRDVSAIHFRRYMERQIGKDACVLLEELRGDLWYGLTGNYLHVPVYGVPAWVARGALVPVMLERDQRTKLPVGRYVAQTPA
ncbi:MAG: tRNA (N(6)-L-threonylcarbamoyladenosine(37)-C(2))-methylthiotransferase MtaB [Sphaerochaetaceae bacterium]|nr:tRNA (N(6)-L-threonylcarbamoyladenosine(37)-C(2))-methylthiotransferase MtaB [Sphaerochaetaceae bacterium]